MVRHPKKGQRRIGAKTAAILTAVMLACAAILSGCNGQSNPAATGASGQPTSSASVSPSQGGAVQTPPDGDSEIQFSTTMHEQDGEIFVEDKSLTVIFNISRESTDYWTLNIASGQNVFNLLEENPPGKVAQDGHSWIFEAIEPGDAVMEFVMYDESGSPGFGYRLTFNVDDSLKITGDADINDLSGSAGNGGDDSGSGEDSGFGEDEQITEMLTVITKEIYETDGVSFEVSPDKYTLLGEDTWLYAATCGNGRECWFIVLSDGAVYINENLGVPRFKKVVLGNYIVIGAPIDNSSAPMDFTSFAQRMADNLLDDPGRVAPANEEYSSVLIDHREVVVYAIAGEFDVTGFIAFDVSGENVFYDSSSNNEYRRVLYDSGNDTYSIGERVTVMPGI